MSIQDEIRNADHQIGKSTAHFDGEMSAEVSRLKSHGKDFSRNGKSIINDGVGITADYLRELARNLKKYSAQALKMTEAHIQNKPAQSIAIAFTVGMVVSLLLRRRGA